MRQNHLEETTARQIVQRAMSIIQYSVNVMNDKGIIIASGDPLRLNQRHEGAVLALMENRVVEIDCATAAKLKGVKPGINLPIIFHQQLVGVIGISGEPAQVRAYAELVRMAAELILEQAALLEQTQWEKRYREELVSQLLAEHQQNTSIGSMAAYLGLNLTLPRIALIIELNRPDHESLRQLIDALDATGRDHLVSMNGFNQLVMLKPLALAAGDKPSRPLNKQLQPFVTQLQARFDVRIFVGGQFPGVEGIRRSYLTARAAQGMAERLGLRHKTLYYNDYSLPALLGEFAGTWQAEELGTSWVQLCAADGKGVLRQTLQQYFDQNCDLSQSARQLHIHVNTLRYRLQKIEEITGLKINQLSSLLRLYIGLQIYG
ncbi:sugar diacid recognition domain-containing protein [Yersinia nurmii]|uniref:Regulatory protein n=1 Tax=Yersinia nurmii TaxID=685706 RepID=A0AAW7K236_9GAMM|nr:sugar diacid recognition domain-containing protein [Yersinia nurmii]MDN0089378.1 sugar diacid recognition domain-containing protein [Yersinia nurmii]CNF03039.1 putative regulatory protein [Yersinia nurmii]